MTDQWAPVALVLVSHSRALAEGAAQVAGQMAPGVRIVAAGGTDDDGIGTSFDRVAAAVRDATADGRSTVVLADLGSAVLTVETVFELDETLPARARLASAPFVEGAVAAAVTAQQGAGVEAVLDAAQGAVSSIGPRPVLELVEADAPTGPAGTAVAGEVVATVSAPEVAGPDDVTARVTLRNPLGLHARPAALLARTVAALGVPVTVEGVDATSVLQLMALGATGGREIEVRAHGEGAEAAVAAVVGLVEGGFGEA